MNFPMHFKPIPKIRAIHQTIINSDGISAMSLSCYTCTKCLSVNYSECELVNISCQFSEIEGTFSMGCFKEILDKPRITQVRQRLL
jgi:hypothetical protein